MKNFKLLVVLALLLAIGSMAAGCIGGGGAGDASTAMSATSTTPLNFNQPSNALLRAFRGGENWTYSGSGTLTNNKNGVKLNMAISGTMNMTSVTGGLPTKLAEAASFKFVFTDSTGASTSTTNKSTLYFTQDIITRNCYIVAEKSGSGDYRTVVGLPVLFYGDSTNPASWNATYNYSDGAVKTKSVTYLGEEIITVPAGTFKTFKINNVSSILKTDGSHEINNANEWMTPDGQTIKGEYAIASSSSTQDISMSYNMLMSSTNVKFEAPEYYDNLIFQVY